MLTAQDHIVPPAEIPPALEKFLSTVLTVIIVYRRPVKEVIRRIRSALPQITLFVYDNGELSSETDDPLVIYRHDPENHGVSRGYNLGFEEAVRQKKSWLLLLDQDTEITVEFLQLLSDATKTWKEFLIFTPVLADMYGVVSPFRWIPPLGVRLKNPAGSYALKSHRFANSGVLISCEAFRLATGYDENLPLDFSDIDFAERLMKVTSHFYVINTTLTHSLSATGEIPLTVAIERFTSFMKASVRMRKKYGNKIGYQLYSFYRAIKLSLIFGSPVFLRLFFRQV